MKQRILNEISDLCSDFLYYDRKGSDLKTEQLNECVRSGEITIDEMVAEFKKHLVNTFPSQEQPPKKAPTTYRECLEALPDGYRELALENVEKRGWYYGNPNDLCSKIYEAISCCILWSKTPKGQGYDFWEAVYNHYKKGTPLPELPNNE